MGEEKEKRKDGRKYIKKGRKEKGRRRKGNKKM